MCVYIYTANDGITSYILKLAIRRHTKPITISQLFCFSCSLTLDSVVKNKMALNSPPLEQFNYNGDHLYDSFLDIGDDMALSSLLSGSIDSSSFGANYASTSNNCAYSTSSFLNFNQEDECDAWIDAMDQNNHVSKYQNGTEMMNGCSLINGAIGEKRCGESRKFVFPYPSSSHIDYVQESLKQEKISRKRSYEV
jgi:hypothetical protein